MEIKAITPEPEENVIVFLKNLPVTNFFLEDEPIVTNFIEDFDIVVSEYNNFHTEPKKTNSSKRTSRIL